MLRKFLRDESGATAIEYSLIAGFIALAIIAAVGMTGERLVALFASLIPALQGMVPVETIEVPKFGLQNRCSTAELNRRMKQPMSGEGSPSR